MTFRPVPHTKPSARSASVAPTQILKQARPRPAFDPSNISSPLIAELWAELQNEAPGCS